MVEPSKTYSRERKGKAVRVGVCERERKKKQRAEVARGKKRDGEREKVRGSVSSRRDVIL